MLVQNRCVTPKRHGMWEEDATWDDITDADRANWKIALKQTHQIFDSRADLLWWKFRKIVSTSLTTWRSFACSVCTVRPPTPCKRTEAVPKRLKSQDARESKPWCKSRLSLFTKEWPRMSAVVTTSDMAAALSKGGIVWKSILRVKQTGIRNDGANRNRAKINIKRNLPQ